MAGDEARRCFLLADYVHHILAIEVARLAEEELLIMVVVVLVIVELPRDVAIRSRRVVAHLDGHIVRVDHAPARKGAGALLDILLGVVAHTHREQLENLPTVVLVDRAFVVVLVVQPHQHAGVAGELH